MICRMWHGWTGKPNAAAYETYLRDELFPRLERELSARGYLGYHLLRTDTPDEVEFVTLVWFESIEAVKSFAGENYQTPVISEKAQRLLAHYAGRCEHYDLRAHRPPG